VSWVHHLTKQLDAFFQLHLVLLIIFNFFKFITKLPINELAGDIGTLDNNKRR
jgi:hypothetical protein